MSTIREFKLKNVRSGYKMMIEEYNSAFEVSEDCKSRAVTNYRFDDKSKGKFGSWEGVETYEEALGYMKNGYQPIVEKLKIKTKCKKTGTVKRTTFSNNIVGYAPVVPLALKGVPNCMIDMRQKPIKCKVIDIYYDMTCSCSTDSEEIINAGSKLLGVLMELESQGYRFNIYAVQSYSDSKSCDMLTVKVKNSTQPLDLKRISFPLTHTAFFRVIGFDWYSRTPRGTYRSGYGHGLSYEFTKRDMDGIFEECFGSNSLYIAAKEIKDKNEEYLREVITNGR